jgi:L-lactate utilization protein LutB
MDNNKKWYYEKKVEKLFENLKAKNYEAYYVETKEDAKKKILELIKEGSTIGLGGSATLNEIEIIPELRSDKYKLFDRYKPGLTPDETYDIFRKALLSDYFITSTNAITINGELVNVDGTGNRAGAIMFGPDKVIFVAGYNKIADSMDEAIDRVRNEAAPINSKRLSRKTPCTTTGQCGDCNSPERICNSLLVTYRQNKPGRGIVIIVGEELGY